MKRTARHTRSVLTLNYIQLEKQDMTDEQCHRVQHDLWNSLKGAE